MADAAFIQMLGVSKTFGKTQALDNVSFRVEPGAFIFITGPSGAGKSTLINMLACVEKPTTGQISIGEVDVTDLKPRQLPGVRRRIGVVYQDFKLLPDRTVAQNVGLALEVWGAGRGAIRRRVAQVLSLVGLESKANMKPPTLSGGEQQRAALARAIVADPMIVLADEPTGNLDWELSQEILQLLYSINQKGATVVVATHDRQLLRSVPAGVMTLSGGRIVGIEV